MTKSDAKDSLKISVIVGTILTMINKYETLIVFSFSIKDVFQVVLNYVVPFCVASVSRSRYKKKLRKEGVIKP